MECDVKCWCFNPYTMWALALQMEMGPHKDRGKLWPGWELNPRPSGLITAAPPTELQGQTGPTLVRRLTRSDRYSFKVRQVPPWSDVWPCSYSVVKLTYLSMQIFSTWGTKTWSILIMVCKSNFCFQEWTYENNNNNNKKARETRFTCRQNDNQPQTTLIKEAIEYKDYQGPVEDRLMTVCLDTRKSRQTPTFPRTRSPCWP